jgi:lysophospholipase L1-like esterase
MRFQTILAILLAGLTGLALASYALVSRPWLVQQLHERFFSQTSTGLYQINRRAFTSRLAAQAEPGRIWFIGHSHVEGMDVTQIDQRGLNLGIGGDTIDGVRQRLRDYQQIDEAAAIVLLIGANDLKTTPLPEMVSQARQLSATLPQAVPLLWVNILPVNPELNTSFGPEEIAAANAAFKTICATHPNCRFIDAKAPLADGRGYLTPDYHESDGLHLSRAGYEKLRMLLKAELAQVVPAQE